MSDDMRFDVRTLAYRKRRGELTDAEIQKHLDGLPDDAERGQETETRFVAAYAARQEDSEDSDE